MGNCAPSKPVSDVGGHEPSRGSAEEAEQNQSEAAGSTSAEASVSKDHHTGDEVVSPKQVKFVVESSSSAGGVEKDEGEDHLEKKLKRSIDRAREDFKVKELRTAVGSLEKTCELLQESHEQDSRKKVTELCSCITDLIVAGATNLSETGRTSRLLEKFRERCARVQKENEVVDAERLAMEYQKYEKETELEELNFKFEELKQKFDMQEGLHLKEQRAFETASQELKIKYEKHFKALSFEIENLQRQLSVVESYSKKQIEKLEGEKESLAKDCDIVRVDLQTKNSSLESELASTGDILSRTGEECTNLRFIVESMERNLVGLGDVGISELLEEVLTMVDSFFRDFSGVTNDTIARVKDVSSEVTRCNLQMENSQTIIHALQDTVAARRKLQMEAEAKLEADKAKLSKENKALTLKVLDVERENAALKKQLKGEMRSRAAFQEKYLELMEAEMDDATPLMRKKGRATKTPKSIARYTADGEEYENDTFYTPLPFNPEKPLPYAEVYSSPVREDAQEESELELLGQLDAQRTYQDVEMQAYRILRDERLDSSQSKQPTEDFVKHIVEENRQRIRDFMHTPGTQQKGDKRLKSALKNTSQKKLESFYT